MKYIAILLALFAAAADAQTIKPRCLPTTDYKSQTASPPYTGMSKNGAWVIWYCYLPTKTTEYPTAVQRNTYVGTLAELTKVGGRVATLEKAADPLKSLQDAPKRFTVLPLTDPSLAGVLADMKK